MQNGHARAKLPNFFNQKGVILQFHWYMSVEQSCFGRCDGQTEAATLIRLRIVDWDQGPVLRLIGIDNRTVSALFMYGSFIQYDSKQL